MPRKPPNADVRSPLRYPGGKSRISAWVLENLPPHKAYCEPYMGSCSILLNKEECLTEVANDLDGEIVAMFKVMRESPDELIHALWLTPFARKEFELSYEKSDDPVEQARRTIVRSQMGFGPAAVAGKNTGFRMSMRHEQNKTSGAHDCRTLPEQIRKAIHRLRAVCFECRPALELIRSMDRRNGSEAVLYYVDPPYVTSTRSLRNKHDAKHEYRHEMTDADHVALAKLLHSVKGMVVLSGYDCPLYDRLYKGWEKRVRVTYAQRGGKRFEYLWLNDKAVIALGGKAPKTGLFLEVD